MCGTIGAGALAIPIRDIPHVTSEWVTVAVTAMAMLEEVILPRGMSEVQVILGVVILVCGTIRAGALAITARGIPHVTSEWVMVGMGPDMFTGILGDAMAIMIVFTTVLTLFLGSMVGPIPITILITTVRRTSTRRFLLSGMPQIISSLRTITAKFIRTGIPQI